MIKHHPDINILTEYAAGTLEWALGLSVAAHIHFCPVCKAQISILNDLGGTLLKASEDPAVDDALFAQVMQRIHEQQALAPQNPPQTKLHPSVAKDPMLLNLPKAVKKLLPQEKPLRWKWVTPDLRMKRLKTGQDKFEVALQKIGIGGKVAEHNHKGLEVTVVLTGCFSDGDGVYSQGDYLVRRPGEVHRPTAAQNQDCLCLSISEAPVQLTGMLGKLLNPFLSIHPA